MVSERDVFLSLDEMLQAVRGREDYLPSDFPFSRSYSDGFEELGALILDENPLEATRAWNAAPANQARIIKQKRTFRAALARSRRAARDASASLARMDALEPAYTFFVDLYKSEPIVGVSINDFLNYFTYALEMVPHAETISSLYAGEQASRVFPGVYRFLLLNMENEHRIMNPFGVGLMLRPIARELESVPLEDFVNYFSLINSSSIRETLRGAVPADFSLMELFRKEDEYLQKHSTPANKSRFSSLLTPSFSRSLHVMKSLFEELRMLPALTSTVREYLNFVPSDPFYVPLLHTSFRARTGLEYDLSSYAALKYGKEISSIPNRKVEIIRESPRLISRLHFTDPSYFHFAKLILHDDRARQTVDYAGTEQGNKVLGDLDQVFLREGRMLSEGVPETLRGAVTRLGASSFRNDVKWFDRFLAAWRSNPGAAEADYPDLLAAAGIRSQYTIYSMIGSGVSGCVFKSYFPSYPDPFAIKVCLDNEHDSSEGAILHSFPTAALNHIVRVYYAGEEFLTFFGKKRYAVVMEYVPGQTLEEVVSAGPLSREQVLDYVGQLLDATIVMRENGVAHADLHPKNIKITPDGLLKVLDFGFAQYADNHSSSEHNRRWGVLHGQKPDDLFSFTLLTAYLCSGVHPLVPQSSSMGTELHARAVQEAKTALYSPEGLVLPEFKEKILAQVWPELRSVVSLALGPDPNHALLASERDKFCSVPRGAISLGEYMKLRTRVKELEAQLYQK